MATKTKQRKYRVGVIHDGQDRYLAKKVAEDIRTTGATPFVAENDIEAGEEWELRLLRELKRADEVLVLLNTRAVERRYVWMEVGCAWGLHLPITVALQGMSLTDFFELVDIPIYLKKTQPISLNEIERYFKALRRRVRRATGQEGKA